MRKTSQDGGDSNSITSGIDSDLKKSTTKAKKSSVKRKIQNISLESDKAVMEPLLQKDKDKTEISNHTVNNSVLSKPKTETATQKENDRENLLQAEITQTCIVLDGNNTDSIILSSVPDTLFKSASGVQIPLHNHMNTNVFNNHDILKSLPASKTHILVEIEGTNQSGYNSSPLIFTTAKIHTDFKTKHMEPLQITSVMSTIEVSIPEGTNNNAGESSACVISQINTKLSRDNINIPNNKTNSPDKFASQNLADATAPSSKNKAITSNSVLSNNNKTAKTNSVTHNIKETDTGNSNKTAIITEPGKSSKPAEMETSIGSTKSIKDSFSTDNKQLRRQKVAIDKDDPLNSSIANGGKQVQNLYEPNNLNFKTKLPKSIAHNVQTTIPFTSTDNTIAATTATKDKSPVFNSIPSIKPSTISQATSSLTSKIPKFADDIIVVSITQPSSVIKPSSNTATPISGEVKCEGKSQTPTTASPMPLTTTLPNTKTTIPSKTEIPTSSQLNSNSKLTSLTTTVTSKLTESTKIVSPVSTNTTKSSTLSTTSVKKPSITSSTVKQPITKNNTTSVSKATTTVPSPSVAIATTTIPTATLASTSNSQLLNKNVTKSSKLGDGNKNVKAKH